MTLLCKMVGHVAESRHHRNRGMEFTACHHCGCDLVRPHDGEWVEVPKGTRVVWRTFGRNSDAASVAARMAGLSSPPRRRAPRDARPQPRRDRRGKPLTGVSTMFGALGSLGALISGNEPVDDNHDHCLAAGGQTAICLPHALG